MQTVRSRKSRPQFERGILWIAITYPSLKWINRGAMASKPGTNVNFETEFLDFVETWGRMEDEWQSECPVGYHFRDITRDESEMRKFSGRMKEKE